MKTNIALILSAFLLSTNVFAENPIETKEKTPAVQKDSLVTKNTEQPAHQTFKGIPLCGTESEFNKALLNKGFKYDSRNVLTGTFSGYAVTVLTETTYASKEVYRANAICPTRNSWNEVKKDFRLFQMNLTAKYGKPFRESWQFSYPYSEGDGYEWKAFSDEKAKCSSTWQTKLGEIRISIEKNTTGLYLRITYSDYEGYNRNETEKNKMYLEDL